MIDTVPNEASGPPRWSRRFYETYFEEWDEPDYVSVKCRDPDGYVVETAWEPHLK